MKRFFAKFYDFFMAHENRAAPAREEIYYEKFCKFQRISLEKIAAPGMWILNNQSSS